MRIVERLAGHYEAQDVQFGKVYTLRPESVLVECECGKRATYERTDITSGSVSSCKCGRDPTSRVRGELDVEVPHEEEEDRCIHPWRYWRPAKDSGIPF